MSKCNSCANHSTPLCNVCTFIEHSKGESDPSQYCDVSDQDTVIQDIAAIIEARIKNNNIIDLRYVIKYNKLLEERKNGKKENISTP